MRYKAPTAQAITTLVERSVACRHGVEAGETLEKGTESALTQMPATLPLRATRHFALGPAQKTRRCRETLRRAEQETEAPVIAGW